MSAKPHRHRAQSSIERTYSGPVPSAKPNPSARGWIVVVEKCACGAERRTNRNGYHTEQGKWVDTGKLNPPETLAQFAARIGVKLWPRAGGVLAIIPMPDLWRQDAYHLSDYYVSASVSGPCLEFRKR